MTSLFINYNTKLKNNGESLKRKKRRRFFSMVDMCHNDYKIQCVISNTFVFLEIVMLYSKSTSLILTIIMNR